MSVSVKGKTFPKSGKELPFEMNRRQRARKYARAIADVLQEELRRGASIKTIMNWTGASERTVKVWLAGSSGPSGEYLIALLGSSEAVFECVLAMAGRRPIVNRNSLENLKARMADLSEAIAVALS